MHSHMCGQVRRRLELLLADGALPSALAVMHVLNVAMQVACLGKRFATLFTSKQPQFIVDPLVFLQGDSLVKALVTNFANQGKSYNEFLSYHSNRRSGRC